MQSSTSFQSEAHTRLEDVRFSMGWWDAASANGTAVIVGAARLGGRPVWVGGMHNSGTNFLVDVLRRNGVDASESNRDGRRTGCWKHTPPWWAPPNLHTRTVMLVIVRHPVDWAVSMIKTHYDIECEDWSDLARCAVRRKTFQPDRMLCDSLMPPRHERAAPYLDDLWALYVTGWRARRGFVTVRYEDVLTRPDAWWTAMRLPPLGIAVALPPQPSKTHGKPRGSTDALRALRAREGPRALGARLYARVCANTANARVSLSYAC
jgi:hypothetical protein